jgi:thioredoxin-like negative regulator of GroEL
MTSLTLTALMHAALISTGAPTYAEAHKLTADTGRPLVVFVGADWCPACQVMKTTTLPQLQQRGGLSRVSFAVVNTDRDSQLAQQLMEPGVIPQLIMYRKTPEGWQRDALVGSRSSQEIQSFIQRGLDAPTVQLGSR